MSLFQQRKAKILKGYTTSQRQSSFLMPKSSWFGHAEEWDSITPTSGQEALFGVLQCSATLTVYSSWIWLCYVQRHISFYLFGSHWSLISFSTEASDSQLMSYVSHFRKRQIDTPLILATSFYPGPNLRFCAMTRIVIKKKYIQHLLSSWLEDWERHDLVCSIYFELLITS